MTAHRTSLAVALALGSLVLGGATARADDGTPVEKLTTKLAYLLEEQPFAKPAWTSTVAEMATLDPPSACFDLVKASRVAADAHVYSSQAFRWASARQDDQGTYITGVEVQQLCARYQATYIHEYAEAAVVEAFLGQEQMKRAVEGQYEAEASKVGASGEECAKRVDAALAAGVPPTETIVSSRYALPAIELGAAKATYCQPAIAFAAKRVGEISSLAQAKQDAIIAVYKKAGIKGKRLELFVTYGMPENTGFLAAGCETWVTSLKALKSAKKLFVWLEGDAGYTVRKFTFSGDRYTVSEKEFSTKEGAYRGCK